MDLPSNAIFNCIGPTDNLLKIKSEFYKRLESSILTNGFRNPILVCAGYCPNVYQRNMPKFMKDDPNKILSCVKLGGSRLYIAQKHNLIIPCIVSDFKDICKGLQEYTNNELYQFFKDKPDWIIFGNHGVSTSMLQFNC